MRRRRGRPSPPPGAGVKIGATRSCGALTLVMMIGSACKESEAEREDRAMRDAVPMRLQPDGAIKLSDPDQKALGLVVATAAEGDLSESWTRFGVVVARPEDEAVLAMPLTGRVEKAKGIELGSDVKSGDFIAINNSFNIKKDIWRYMFTKIEA